ncbi:transglutaminase-like domain-containing protein [Methylomonas koyamae]|uniref:transglutaminase-like domain-containing protein n=1 Tax=Methylomonas koyamae TaxID=702114 RepID=UPI00278BF1A0|nr:transglutaminase family protein [Methylomonas koyamae]
MVCARQIPARSDTRLDAAHPPRFHFRSGIHQFGYAAGDGVGAPPRRLQDFAHLAIGCIRSQGLAARYVSGYIETLPPPGQAKLVGADASHAWFSVYLPDLGWMDFDPTNNQTPGDRHIVVAWGRDYSDVTPLKGVIFGGQDHELSVSVEVENLGL